MPLGDIHRKLYNKQDDIDKRRMADDFFDPKKSLEKTDQPSAPSAEPTNRVNPKATQEMWLSPEDIAAQGKDTAAEQAVHKKKFLKIGLITLGALTFLTIVVLGIVKYQESTFSEDRVQMQLFGPTDIKSGDEVTFDVSVTNHNKVSLDKSVLHFNLSEDFMLDDQPGIVKEGFNGAKTEIGSLEPGENVSFSIKAKVFGPISKQVYFNTSIIYQPSNFSSTFEKKAQLPGIIRASLLTVNVFSTREAASGEEIELQVLIQNSSKETFSDLQLQMDYPEGFTYASSQPQATDKKTWDIPSVKPSSQEKIVIRGSLEGSEDSVKNFKGFIGKKRTDAAFLKLSEAEAVTRVVSPRLVIKQLVNGKENFVANSGENMEFQIRFRNNSNVALRDIIVSNKLTSRVLDKTSVSVSNGFYDSNTDQLMWKASDVPSLKVLEPGAETSVSFKARIAERFPMENANDKNFTLVSQATLESLDIDSPLDANKKVFSNTQNIKINSKLILNVAANYNDGELPNSGPMPVKYGEETTFTARLNVLNTSNDLKNVVLTASLPTGVKWKNKYVPEGLTGVEFNERTNELKWNLGTVDAGTGFLLPVRVLGFQLGVTPSVNQNLNILTMLNPIKVTAVDNFTNESIQYTFGQLNVSDVADN